MWQSLGCCWVGWHTSADGLARVNVQLPILPYIPSLSWLGHQATHLAKVALLCVPWSVFPFVYVALFPGIIISGGTWAHSWPLIIFPAVYFIPSTFHEAL